MFQTAQLPTTRLPVEFQNLVGVIAHLIQTDPQVVEALRLAELDALDDDDAIAAAEAAVLAVTGPASALQRTCRVCGCTDERGCPNGCWWVEDDLCSNCDEAGEAQPAGMFVIHDDGRLQ